MCVGVSMWLGWSGIRASACNTDTTPTQTHRNSNTHRTKNNTTNVVIQQNSRKLLMMDILMSKTFWAHKKWNKITSDIKLVFYSSTITMMHGPVNIRFIYSLVKSISYHLFSFRKSVQDYIIHMDMEIVIFFEIKEWHQHSVYNNHMVIWYDKCNKIRQYKLFSVIKYNKDTNKNQKWR